MNRRLLTVLLFALVVAGVASLLVYRMLNQKVSANHASRTIKVVAASADIKLGTILNASNLTTIEIAGSLPKGVLVKPEDAIGRGVTSDLYQGEPILDRINSDEVRESLGAELALRMGARSAT